MKMTFKRITAWMLTLMMIVSCVPAYAADGNVVDYSAATSAYDVMPLDDGETETTATENITVTFVINNSNYTSDPGSGNTHVTATSSIEGGELTYTKWSGKYKVTGTGTVCSYTIPAGTSLSDNGYSLPALSVTNIGNANTYTYASLITWVTGDGMVCRVDTDFEEDTTLSLQLYESSADKYSIDYICGTHNHSIHSGGTFNLGQSVSAAEIAAATEKANVFESQWCTEGPASGEQLQKWQLKITETGEMVDLTAGMPITADYVDSTYGTLVKAYAVWEAASAWATFQYEQTVDGTPTTVTLETRELNAGDTLGELPDMTAYTPEGSTFIGWQYTDSEGNAQYATAETVITADTVFTAVFGSLVTATFQYTQTAEDGTQTTETIETYSLNVGDALGTLPDMTAYNTLYEIFEGWQYGTDAEGNPLYATADMVITENMVFTAVFAEVECGEIFFYDVQPDGTTTEDHLLSILMPVGMTLTQVLEHAEGSLSDDTLLSECIWRTAVNGELADLTNTLVSAETPISLYTHTYQIILKLSQQSAAEAAGIMTLSLVETETADDGTMTLTITAREGETLTADQLVVNGVDLTQYVWTDGEGNAVDLQALTTTGVTESVTATSDGTLVSTGYTLTLTLTLDGETKTYTITKAEGETFTADDFVIDGQDLTVFTWTGGVENLESLVGTTLTADTALTSDGALDSDLEVKTNKVNFYVYLDDEPFRVASKTVTSYKESDADRRYISAATLAAVYGEYGFSASRLQSGTTYFPHTDENGAKIWADASVLEENGLCYSPIVNGSGNVDVYYLPEQWTLDASSAGKTESSIVDANTFYTMKVEDPAGIVYTKDTLPEQTITFNGGSTSITVQPAPEGAEWECVGKDGSVIAPVVNGDGTLTYSVSDIQQPYVISIKVENNVIVSYDVNLPYVPADEEYGRPTINNGDTYGLVLDAESAEAYTLLAPSMNSYFYTSGKYLGEATFLGWAINGNTENLIQPGEEIDLSTYVGQTVTVTAQWETKLGGTSDEWDSPMINFFVALNAVSEGTEEWVGNTSISDFTTSVYTSDGNVTGRTAVNQGLYVGDPVVLTHATQYHVLGGTSGTNLNSNHSTIVSELTAGHTKTGTDGNTYTFTASFPSDETVLRNVRRMIENGETTIKINGREIAADDLTTSNFTIKWYVFKFDNTDGWHIDGILVAKSSEMIVTKTFAGDTDAINEVKSGFSIEVEGGSIHTGEKLTISNADSVNKNVYTWKVPVDIYYDYTVEENDYSYSENLATYKSQYRVRHSNTASQNTGWTTYSDSSNITVTGRGYNETDDERLQVDFLNTYTAAGTVVLQKIDAVTGNLMPGVSFTISKTMYDLGNGHYSADPTDSANGAATTTIVTDSSGQAYLWIGGGDYTLTETVPDGYDDPGVISIKLEGEAGNEYKVIAITSATSANETSEKDFVTTGSANDLTLIVKNYSRTIDLTVTKIWTDQENKPVTIQLYRDGKALGADYTVSFTASDYTDGVATYTYKGLPLYADGGLAQYTLREEAIGDFKYSDEYSDGYRYYDVNRSAMKYLDADGNVTGDMTAVKTIALSVTNERSHGSLAIEKVDENGTGIAGAEFYLYSAPEASDSEVVPTVTTDSDGNNVLSGMTPVKTATSIATGTVSFADIDAGRYYLIEHSAPTGYTGSSLLYSLQFDGDRATMQYYDTAANAWKSTSLSVANTSIKTNIPVTKIWVDGSDAYGTRPDSISVTLTGKVGDEVVIAKQATITGENSDTNLGENGTAVVSDTWTYTFENVPKYSNGSEITYTVSESAVSGYETTYDQDKREITNTLIGNLTYTVNKQIKGNFADPSKAFKFTAVIKDSAGNTIKTETSDLTGGASWTITGIPYGATVTVTEDPDGYDPAYQLGQTITEGEATYTTGAIVDNSQGVTFINTKNVTIDTGVDLDGLPYTMMLLSMAGLGLVWLLARRRRNEA